MKALLETKTCFYCQHLSTGCGSIGIPRYFSKAGPKQGDGIFDLANDGLVGFCDHVVTWQADVSTAVLVRNTAAVFLFSRYHCLLRRGLMIQIFPKRNSFGHTHVNNPRAVYETLDSHQVDCTAAVLSTANLAGSPNVEDRGGSQ